jgi:hypothetical protein
VTGSGSVAQASGWYGQGTNVAITASPAANWQFSVWTGDTNGSTINSNRITVYMNKSCSVSAVFKPASAPLASFDWNAIPTPQVAGVPFPVSIRARDANNITVMDFDGAVRLSAIGAARSVMIGTGTSTSDYPMHAINDDARMQVIYLTNEIGRACAIKALALNVSMVPGQTLKNWTIRMKHTTLSKFAKGAVWEWTGWTTVYQEDQSVGTNGWVEFVLSPPFYYNGTNHLMVDFSFNNSLHTVSGFCRYTTARTRRGLYNCANSTYGDPLTWSRSRPKVILTAALPNLRLQCDDPVVITPGTIAGFVNGIWAGSISVSGPVAGLAVIAEDEGGHLGSANLFDVVDVSAAPALAMFLSVPPPPPLPTTNLVAAISARELTNTIPPASPVDITQASPGGIPPFISIAREGEGTKLGIRGTVGADIIIQTSSNLANPLAWQFLKNLLLTNASPASDEAPVAPLGTLEVAFVPALEWFALSVATSAPSQFFRVVMPYNYAVLADKVLKSKGYQTRLIVTRLAGETLHDVCYVGEDAAYIDCSEDRFILALNYSGATIREIADDYGGYVSMNWTSASEFVFTNGVRQLVSTVVKTDSPSSDPPLAGTESPSIVVDF